MIELDVHVFAEARRVIIPGGFGIAKRFQNGVRLK